MEYIRSFNRYLNNGDRLNEEEEGWKTWMATFMLLLNMGIVPPNIKAADTQTKIEWVKSIPQDIVLLAKLASVLSQAKDVSMKDDEKIVKLLYNFNKTNNSKLTMANVKGNLKCEAYQDDDGTRYKWFYTTYKPSVSHTEAFSIDSLKPAKYEDGKALVNDYGDFLTPKVEDSLNKVLLEYARKTDIQITILTIPSLYGQDPQEYCQKIFTKWGIGKKGQNNGILIMTSMGDRKSFMATGYGMEGDFPDAICKRFCTDYLVPNFKEGNYDQGFREIIQNIKSTLGTEIPIQMKKALDAKYEKQSKENAKNFFIGLGEFVLLMVVLGLLAYLIVSSVKKRRALNVRINNVKANIQNVDAQIADLIQNGDPIFDDDAVLKGLKDSVDALNQIKFKNREKIDAAIAELETIMRTLKNLIIREKAFLSIKNDCLAMREKLTAIQDVPTEMSDVAKTATEILNKLSFEKIDVSKASVDNYKSKLASVQSYYKKYSGMLTQLEKIKVRTAGFETMKTELLAQLETSKKYVAEITELGYETDVDNVTPESINDLKTYIDQIGNIVQTDMTQAITLLGEYETKTKAMYTSIQKPMKKFDDLITARKYIKDNGHAYIDIIDNINTYISAGYLTDADKRQSEELIEAYEALKIQTTNVLDLANALQTLVKNLQAIVEKGQVAYEYAKKRAAKKKAGSPSSRSSRSSGYSPYDAHVLPAAAATSVFTSSSRDDDNWSSSSSSSSSDYSSSSSSFDFGGGSSGGGGGGANW
jgi:uncharacterized membrane protein YgcG